MHVVPLVYDKARGGRRGKVSLSGVARLVMTTPSVPVFFFLPPTPPPSLGPCQAKALVLFSTAEKEKVRPPQRLVFLW